MRRSEEFELRKKCNDLDAYCGVRDVLLNDGPNRGVRAFELRNGRNLELTMLADRGLDVASLRYRGINIGLNNKVGLRSPYLYQEDGASGFLKQFHGGLLTTCGITRAGAAGVDGGRPLGLHGPFSNLPASQARAWVDYEGDERVLKVAGLVREAEVFGANMVMRRDFTLHSDRDLLRVRDTVTNQGYEPQPLMLVYHVNFGYPLLDAGAVCYFSSGKVSPCTASAARGIENFCEMEEPGCGREEQCYLHSEWPEGEAMAMLHNEKLGIAAVLRFDERALPLLCQWKCMRAGEYALGLEPTTSGIANRSEARSLGRLGYLAPGESREFRFTIELTDDASEIDIHRLRASLC